MGTLRLNTLPSPTWNRLDINDITVTLPEGMTEKQPFGKPELTALGGGFCGLVGQTDMISQSAELDIELGRGETRGFYIKVPENGSISVIMYISCESGAVRTVAEIPEGSQLRLVQIIEGGSQLLNDMGADISDGGRLDVTQIFLSGEQSVSGVYACLSGWTSMKPCATFIAGFRSELSYKGAYILRGKEKLDINNITVHKGKKTRSQTELKGVLSDSAEKTFRGTIDFKNGASGSVGAETEDVLLLSENTVNKTLPVILCSEEDVEGSHGASIGRLDENALYYMTSRGIPEKTAMELAATARIERLIALTGSERAEERALKALSERSGNAIL